MLVCSNPIFTIFKHSKAARFVSVPVLPTVAYCECKEVDMYYMYRSTKRPDILRDKLKKQSKKLESSSVHYATRESHIYWTAEYDAKNQCGIRQWKMFCWDHLIIKSEIIKRKTKTKLYCAKPIQATSLTMWIPLLQWYNKLVIVFTKADPAFFIKWSGFIRPPAKFRQSFASPVLEKSRFFLLRRNFRP